MENCVVCVQCGKLSSLTIHTKTVRCHGCREIIVSGINHEAISSGTNRESSQDQGEIMTNAKHHHNFRFWMNWSCNTNLNNFSSGDISEENDSRCDSISSWKATPGKRALLCGVTYNQQKFKLRGTIHDVNAMSDLLVTKFDFPSSAIHILSEEGAHNRPTKKNIQAALKWLVKDCQSGDSLVFYFSGHGLRQPDFNQDERDGYDETICPLDFRTKGMINDNEINDTIVRPLKEGVKLHAFIDSCHSGTVLDLPYVYGTEGKIWKDNRPPSGVDKGTSGGLAICLSACEDDQMAVDTTAFSGKQMAGAMTYSFIKSVKENAKITYNDLLHSMYKTIKDAIETRGFKLRRIFHRGKIQEPLLSSSKEFDVNSELKL